MKDFALIKNGIVERVIFGDLNFIKAAGLDQNYDACVDLSELDPRPGDGWAYDGENFTAPVVEEPPPEEP